MAATVIGLLAPNADAAHPGVNGKILFESWGTIDSSAGTDAGDYDIWTVELDGSGLTNLTNAPGIDTDAKWSPDGTRVVFSSNRAGRNATDYDVYVMDTDGSHLKRLTSAPGSQSYASWSPTGRRIAFRDERGLWIMDADGSEKELVYNAISSDSPLGGEINHVDWSPDGGLIAFSMDAGEPTLEDIWVIRPDGSGMRMLYASDGFDIEPDFSPNGRYIAFAQLTPCISLVWCYSDVVVVRRDGTDSTNLTSTPSLIEQDPAWSPDGKQIVYVGDNTIGADLDIWVMDADGRNRRSLGFRPESYDYQPNWQPLKK